MPDPSEDLAGGRVAWSATSAADRSAGAYATTSVPEFLAQLEALLALGEGHVEVGHAERDFPTLSVAFREGFAVVHCFDSVESSSLLVGDPELSGGGDVTLTLVEPGDGAFTAEFVHRTDVAVNAVRRFVAGASPEQLGEWRVL